MVNSNKCLIDNWSIEQAAGLMHFDIDYYIENGYDLFSNIGGLSNFINAILLYKHPFFLSTGNEFTWQRFSKFRNAVQPHIFPVDPIEKHRDCRSYLANKDKGANYYLMTSKYLDAELFLSAERSTKIIEFGIQENDNDLIEVLNTIDKMISEKTESFESKKVKIGIQNNFILPTLTHYVLSEANSKDDLLEVIIQLKRSNKISKLNEKITDLHSSIKNYTRFQKELNILLKKEFNEDNASSNNLEIGISVLFLSLSKSINLDFLNNKTYLTYLKDLVSCRTETYGLKKHVNRIFKTNIDKFNRL